MRPETKALQKPAKQKCWICGAVLLGTPTGRRVFCSIECKNEHDADFRSYAANERMAEIIEMNEGCNGE